MIMSQMGPPQSSRQAAPLQLGRVPEGSAVVVQLILPSPLCERVAAANSPHCTRKTGLCTRWFFYVVSASFQS